MSRPPYRFATLVLPTLIATAASDAQRPWEERMRAFEAEDAAAPERGGIVFVGSSSIRLWDLARSFGPGSATPLRGPLRNRGFGGSQVEHTADQIELLALRHRPRRVVLYAGDNDIAAGKSAERVAADFDRVVAALHAELPKSRLAYIAIKPSLSRWSLRAEMLDANERIRRRCDTDERLTFIDIWAPMLGADGGPRPELFVDDGLHLSPAGYALWTQAVHEALTP